MVTKRQIWVGAFVLVSVQTQEQAVDCWSMLPLSPCRHSPSLTSILPSERRQEFVISLTSADHAIPVCYFTVSVVKYSLLCKGNYSVIMEPKRWETESRVTERPKHERKTSLTAHTWEQESFRVVMMSKHDEANEPSSNKYEGNSLSTRPPLKVLSLTKRLTVPFPFGHF